MDKTATGTDATSAIGRTLSTEDVIDVRQARLMQVTLDRAPSLADGDPLPPFWHYIYFNPMLRASVLGADGHERLGTFIPDFGLPRRMWAGGRMDFHAPLTIGEKATRRSRIAAIDEKNGRSGRLVFVTLEHVISAGGAPRLTETQTVVYRAAPEPGAAAPEGPEIEERAEFSREVDPDTVLLFRYSALIFFGHRIHYDLPYTREVEGHPDLLVHGPLTATLLTDLGLTRLEGRRLTGLSIRALQPLYAGRPFTLEGRESGGGLRLWARSPGGRAAMRVDLELSE